MKEFMFLFRGGDARSANQSPEEMQAHMQRWGKWMGELGEKGLFVGGQPLEPSGKTVTGTKMVVSDGPFAEGKEIVGGYIVCKANDIDHAVEISKGCPILEFGDGIVEVRAIQHVDM